jgi:hypothetical protein
MIFNPWLRLFGEGFTTLKDLFKGCMILKIPWNASMDIAYDSHGSTGLFQRIL